MKKRLLLLPAFGLAVSLSGAPESAALHEFEKYVFTRTSGEFLRKGIRTDGVVVLRAGKIVYEKYAAGYTATTPHAAWSVSKSLAAALFGIAIGEGRMSLDDEACQVFPKMKTLGTCGITLRHLLQMSSGLKWKEGYEDDPVGSNDIEMLFGPGRTNVIEYATSMPAEVTPGTRWHYSSGDNNIAYGMLTRALGSEAGTYPWRKLFEPLGMTSAVFERDPTGFAIGSDGIHLTPRDLAKFGLLYLQDGVWENRRLLPEGWTHFTLTLPQHFDIPAPQVPWGHALHTGTWWINAAPSALGLGTSWPEAPKDTFAALGYWGQSIFVLPSLDLVLVRTADDRDTTFDHRRYLALALAAFGAAPATRIDSDTADRKPRRDLLALPGEAAGFTAKQVCTCLFVAGLDESFCRNLGRQAAPVVVGIRYPKKQVNGTFLAARRQARYEGPGVGCTLY